MASQMEKHFQMHTLYKRSRPILDLQKLKIQEDKQEIRRRKPNKCISTLDTRVDSSFLNSGELAHQRIEKDISDMRKRYEDENETNYTTIQNFGTMTVFPDLQEAKKSKTKAKGPDMSKMPPRPNCFGSKAQYKNEDQFNNYGASSPKSKNNFPGFELFSPRSKQKATTSSLAPLKSHQTVDINQTYDKNVFNQALMRCLCDFNKSERLKNSSGKSINSHNNSRSEISSERIKRSEDCTRINPHSHLQTFYMTIGRESPSQMDYKLTKTNQFFFEPSPVRKQKEEFATKKKRMEMESKRLGKISQRKDLPDIRGQMCDQRYFLRKRLAQNKK